MLKVAVVGLLAVIGACSKSKCEKYADMEWKCGNYPAAEEDITRKLAEGMCEAASSEKSEMVQHFAREAECATKHKDCAAYNACTDAIERK